MREGGRHRGRDGGLGLLLAHRTGFAVAQRTDPRRAVVRDRDDQVLQIEDVDREITDRATAQVMQDARTFVAENVPFLSTPADALLERAEPTVSGWSTAPSTHSPARR